MRTRGEATPHCGQHTARCTLCTRGWTGWVPRTYRRAGRVRAVLVAGEAVALQAGASGPRRHGCRSGERGGKGGRCGTPAGRGAAQAAASAAARCLPHMGAYTLQPPPHPTPTPLTPARADGHEGGALSQALHRPQPLRGHARARLCGARHGWGTGGAGGGGGGGARGAGGAGRRRRRQEARVVSGRRGHVRRAGTGPQRVARRGRGRAVWTEGRAAREGGRGAAAAGSGRECGRRM